MESTEYRVRDRVRRTEDLDTMDTLASVPASIRDQMPALAEMLQSLAGQIGQAGVQDMLRASIDIRRAYDADDYRGVVAVYARRLGWVTWAEGGYQIGVPADHLAAFARRHRDGTGSAGQGS